VLKNRGQNEGLCASVGWVGWSNVSSERLRTDRRRDFGAE
jgi:hypothetical protein